MGHVPCVVHYASLDKHDVYSSEEDFIIERLHLSIRA